MPEVQPAILTANLAALRPINPAAADLIASTDIPADWQPATGTDDTPTFARRVSEMQIDWLGRTSMPQASAESLIANMTAGENNGVGTPIGTGYEWKLFADRLPPRLMLFVYEPNPLAAKLALSMCDLSTQIAHRKIIFLIGPDASTQLINILDICTGIEPPAAIHPLPSFSDQVRNTLIASAENMIRATIRHREEVVAAAASQLIQKTWSAQTIAAIEDTFNSAPKSVAIVVNSDPRLPLNRRIQHLAIPAVNIDRHDSASLLSRIDLLQKQDVACIDTDLFRPQIGLPIPPQVIVRTWVPPLASAKYWEPGGLNPQCMESADRVVVHSSAHAQWLVTAGFKAEQILRVRLPFNPGNTNSKAAGARRVAIAADLMPLDPETYRIDLPSHVALWRTLRTLIEYDPLGVHDEMTEDLLKRAQKQIGVHLEDAQLIQMLDLAVRHILLPGCVAVSLAQLLISAGLSLELFGNGWSAAGIQESAQVRIRPQWELAPQTWADTAVIIQAHPAGIVSPAVLHAAECGVKVVAPPHPRDAQPLSLQTYLKDYPRPQKNQFVSTLKALITHSKE